MAKNNAIVIGINQYDFLQPLNYAKQDAQLMQEFLRNEAGFDQIFFFSDDSPPTNKGNSTRPNRNNLLRVLREMFENPFMGAGDNFWFFFSGHGMRHADHDYLMPCDGDPEDIENTAIEITHISKRLRRCGADNVVLILDACRNQGSRSGEGIGNQTAEQARQTGVISIFSCAPNQLSYEIDTLKQGAFTYTLLEGFGSQGRCATVEQLNQYLTERVPQLNRQYGKPNQTPYTITEPITKSHLILLPRYATVENITTLKLDAYRAAQEGELELAEQLWVRVNAATSGKDTEAVRELQRIERTRSNKSSPFGLASQNLPSEQYQPIETQSVAGEKSVETPQPNQGHHQSLFAKIAQHKNKLLAIATVLVFGLVGSLAKSVLDQSQLRGEEDKLLYSKEQQVPLGCNPDEDNQCALTAVLFTELKEKVSDFIVEARFYNPADAESGGWQYGFSFRDTLTSDLNNPERKAYNLLIYPDKSWRLEFDQRLKVGTCEQFDVSNNGSNKLRLVVDGDRANLFVNDSLCAKELDVSTTKLPGNVYAITPSRRGEKVKIENLKIWSIRN